MKKTLFGGTLLSTLLVTAVHTGPLHEAILKADTTQVLQCLEKGESANKLDGYDRLPLHLAAQYGRVDIVAILLTKDADVNNVDGSKRTALHYAALGSGAIANTEEHAQVVRLLLEHSANINAQDATGNTPTHLAARYGYHITLRALLEASPNLEIKNFLHDTPQDVATERAETYFLRPLGEAARTPGVQSTPNTSAPPITPPGVRGWRRSKMIRTFSWKS